MFSNTSTDNGRLSERRELVRNAKRENSNRKEFKTCQGLVRPAIKCENCAPGYPYYDCRKNSESQERFQSHEISDFLFHLSLAIFDENRKGLQV